METFKKPIQHLLEFAYQEIDKDITLMYVRYEGEKEFSRGFVPTKKVPSILKTFERPEFFGDVLMKTKIKGDKHSREGFPIYLYAMSAPFIEEYKTKGVLNFDMKDCFFEPEVFGQVFDQSYSFYWFRSYDHLMLNYDNSFLTHAKWMFLLARNYDIEAIIKDKPENVKIISKEPYYVPGNGYTLDVAITLNDENNALIQSKLLKKGWFNEEKEILTLAGLSKYFREEPLVEPYEPDNSW